MPHVEVPHAFLFGEGALSLAPHDLKLMVPAGLASKRDILQTLSQGLSFPDHFGGNWDALWECICDLSWLNHGQVIVGHDDLPIIADPEQCRTYLSIMKDATHYWATRPEHHLTVIFPEAYQMTVVQLLDGLDRHR